MYAFVLLSLVIISSSQKIVQKCPDDKTKWREREKIWHCEQIPGFFYHCIGTLDNYLVETCLFPRSISLNGQCPFIDLSAGSKFYTKVCPFSIVSECPNGDSTSNHLYEYPYCTNFWKFAGSTLPTTDDGGHSPHITVVNGSYSQFDEGNITFHIFTTSHYSLHTKKQIINERHDKETDGRFQGILFWSLLGSGAVILLLVIIVLKLLCRLRRKSQNHTLRNAKEEENVSLSNTAYPSPVYHVYSEITESLPENGSSSSESYLEPKERETRNPYLVIKHSSYETLPKRTVEPTENICKERKDKQKSSSI